MYTINWEKAPKDWAKFKKWHPLACPNDPLSTEDRYKKEGGKLPEKAAK